MKEKMYPVLVGAAVCLAIVCFSDLFCMDTKYLTTLSHPTVEVMQARPKYLKKKRETKVVPTPTPIFNYPNHALSEHIDAGTELYPVYSLKVTETPTALPASPAPSPSAKFERDESMTTRTR